MGSMDLRSHMKKFRGQHLGWCGQSKISKRICARYLVYSVYIVTLQNLFPMPILKACLNILVR